MPQRSLIFLAAIFFNVFLLLTPLGLFNDWIPPSTHTGYYSVTTIDPGNDAGYYAYLRSAFFDRDLDFANERNYAHNARFTETGYAFNNWQIGQAVLYLPFFLAGHGLALLYNALGYPIAADGYSAPYHIATALASQTYLFIGLILLVQIGRKFFDQGVAWLATISIWLGSPLLYYSFIRQRMAHATEFCFSALFVLAWLNFRTSKNKWNHALLGACLGVLCLVRLINVCYLALYLFDQGWQWINSRKRSGADPFKTAAVRWAVFFALFALVLAPQFYVWNQLGGFPISVYLVDVFKGQTTGIPWGQKLEHLAGIFFGTQWSLLWSLPAGLLGFFGLWIRGPLAAPIRWSLLACFGALLVVLPSFIESDAYGNRYLIPATVPLALGLGALLQKLSRSRGYMLAVVFLAGCVVTQYLFIVQYKILVAYNHPEFSLQALKNIPVLLHVHPDKLLRSTNFITLWLSQNRSGWDFRDGLFLVVFPALQLALVQSVCLVYNRPSRLPPLQESWKFPKKVVLGAMTLSAAFCFLAGLLAPAKSPEQKLARENYSRLMEQGGSLIKKNRVREARSAFMEASTLLPDLWDPYFKTAVTWDLEKQPAKANDYYEKSLSLNPEHGPALMHYGINLMKLGNLEKAEQVLASSIRAWPENKLAYDALAQVYTALKKPGRLFNR